MSVYAVSDLHGHLELWKQIQSFLNPDDKIYVLGDCGDRGPQGWETIKAVYNDPRVIYLKGNHEDMLVNAMEDYLAYEVMNNAFSLLVYNGGYETFSDWMAEGAEQVNWKIKLKKLPLEAAYTNKDGITFKMTHSGCEDKLWGRNFTECIEKDKVILHGHTPNEYLAVELGETWIDGVLWYYNDHKCCLDCGTIHSKTTVLLNLDTCEEIIFELRDQ